MANAAVPIECGNLNCPICFKKFNIPRILTCLHTLCEECLNGQITSDVQGQPHFTCPICKAPTVPPETKLPVEKWASTLPLDNVMFSVLELFQPSDDFCDICKLDNENTTAKYWCTICREKLCMSCNIDHKRIKISRQHSTVPYEEIKDHLSNVLSNLDQDCIRHQGKKQEVFCVDHREICCLVCFSENHRQCTDIRNIDDVADEQAKQMGLFNASGSIEKIRTEIDQVATSKRENVDKLESEKEEMLQIMDDLVDRLVTKLNGLRITFRNEAKQQYIDSKCSVQKNDKNIQSFMTNLMNACTVLENLQKHGSTRQKFVILENVLSQISSHQQQLVSDLKDDQEIHFSLKPNTELLDMEKTLTSLGKIDISSESSKTLNSNITNVDKYLKNLKSRTKVKPIMCAAQVITEKLDLMTSPVTFVKAVARQVLGLGTWFTSGTFLNGGRLIMADINNNRLVQLDEEYNFIKEYKVDGRPTDVAAGNKDNELYIAVGNNSVYRCNLDTKLKVTHRINVPPGTVGLAVTSDNIIIGTATEVVILSFNGSTVKSIPKSGANSYVAVSQPRRTLWHRDYNTVVCRTLKGIELFRYRHDNLKYPRGISFDGQDNVYLCGGDSQNVHQISPDGERTRILLQNLQSMTTLCGVVFNPQNNELIVTSCGENTVFEVYRLG